MQVLRKPCVVALALCIELVVVQAGSELLFGRSHGPLVDTRFRRKERLDSYYAHIYNPSPQAAAAYQEELRLMRQHPNPEDNVLPPLFVAANAAAIFLYLRRRPPAPTA